MTVQAEYLPAGCSSDTGGGSYTYECYLAGMQAFFTLCFIEEGALLIKDARLVRRAFTGAATPTQPTPADQLRAATGGAWLCLRRLKSCPGTVLRRALCRGLVGSPFAAALAFAVWSIASRSSKARSTPHLELTETGEDELLKAVTGERISISPVSLILSCFRIRLRPWVSHPTSAQWSLRFVLPC